MTILEFLELEFYVFYLAGLFFAGYAFGQYLRNKKQNRFPVVCQSIKFFKGGKISDSLYLYSWRAGNGLFSRKEIKTCTLRQKN